MKTSEVFKRAKKYLAKTELKTFSNTQANHICYAIQLTTCTEDDKTRTRRIIHSYLDGLPTFSAWLNMVHGIDYAEDMDKLQRTRHAWLNHLIEHYESIGD